MALKAKFLSQEEMERTTKPFYRHKDDDDNGVNAGDDDADDVDDDDNAGNDDADVDDNGVNVNNDDDNNN